MVTTRVRRPILIVDDDESIRVVLAEVLTEEGYAVALAENGEVALACARATPPSLILLNLRMPIMDGRAFLHAYRQQPAPHPPVVLLTAESNAAAIAAELGADAVVSKPFDITELLAVVVRCVGNPVD